MLAMRGIVVMAALLLSSAAFAKGVPDLTEQEVLIKTTLLSFNDANITGNYTVFQAKTAKPMRDKFSPEQLADAFKVFRDKHIDIGTLASEDPTPIDEAAINDDDILRLHGSFPRGKGTIIYDLKFIQSDGEWKIIGINVDTKAGKN